MKKECAWLCGAAVFAASCAWAREEGVALRPGPDKGGALPESVRNEVEVAVDRGVKWLAEQQKEYGGFEEPDRFLPTFAAMSFFSVRGMKEETRRTATWIARTQLADGSWGGTNWAVHTVIGVKVLKDLDGELEDKDVKEAESRGREWFKRQTPDEFTNAVNQVLRLNPLTSRDTSQVGWRGQLAARHLATQIVNGGAGYWKAKDVEVALKNEDLELWKAFWGVEEVVPRRGGEDVTVCRLPSDLTATLFVMMQLMDL